MNVEEHPGYSQLGTDDGHPMVILHGWLVCADHSDRSLVFFDPEGNYRGAISPDGTRTHYAAVWDGDYFTPDELRTLFALEQLHR